VGPPEKIKRRKMIKKMKYISRRNKYPSAIVMAAMGSCQKASIRSTDYTAKKPVCLKMHP
jgi:hypothetical protein